MMLWQSSPQITLSLPHVCRYFICYISSPHTLVLNARKRWWLSKYCSYCTKQTLSTTHNKKQPHKCLDIIFSFIITRIMNTLHTAITLSSNARVQRAKNVHTEVKMLLSFLECISSTLIQHKERRRWGWRWGEGGRRSWEQREGGGGTWKQKTNATIEK